MSPPMFCSIKMRADSRETKNDPRAITLCCRSQSACVVSSNGFDSESPALFTMRSIPPNAITASFKAAWIGASCETSIATATALSRPRLVATVWAFARFRSAITTQAPSATKRSAMALPIPLPAPVTNATREANGFGLGRRCSLASSSDQYSILNFSESLIGV